MRYVRRVTGWHVGGSTGTNMWGALRLIAQMIEAGQTGSVVTLICDGGERYVNTYDSDEWVAARGLDLEPFTVAIEKFLLGGPWVEP